MNSMPPLPESSWHKIRRFLGAIGRLLAQGALFWFFSIPVLLLMAISPEEWGNNESFLVFKEGLWLALNLISIGLIVKVVDENDVDSLGLRRDKRAIRDFFVGMLITML